MADRGYFLLYRGWRQSDVFKDEPLTEREAWVWLIEEAAYKPRQREVAGKTIGLQRGEVAASLTFLERAWKWSRDRVRWFLTKLEKAGMVAVDKRVGITVIAVANYDHYQPSKPQNHPTANTTAHPTANTTAEQAENCEELDINTTANPTPSTTANPTNEKEGAVKKGSNSGGRATRLPEDWRPQLKHYELGKTLGMAASEVDYEADKFCDHFHSASGQNARKRDWNRAFNNWLRKSAEYGKRTPASKPSPGHRSGPGSVVAAYGDLVHGRG